MQAAGDELAPIGYYRVKEGIHLLFKARTSNLESRRAGSGLSANERAV